MQQNKKNTRDEDIRILSMEGYSLAQLSKKYNISRERVRQIRNYEKIKKEREEKKNSQIKKFQVRVSSFCVNCEKSSTYGYDYCKDHEYLKKLQGREVTREKVRIRDNHTCQHCNRKWNDGERRFDVHHLDDDGTKTREYDKWENSTNLITLCHACHIGIYTPSIKFGCKLTSNERVEVALLLEFGFAKHIIAKAYNVSETTVYNCHKRHCV